MNAASLEGEHPTRRAILLAARGLLAERGLRGFRLEDVLASAFVSKGAVYHHFANFDALVEEAQLDWYRELAQADVESLRVLVEADDLEGLRAAIAATTRAAYAPERHEQRANRVMILASVVHGSDELRHGYAQLQQELNGALAGVIRLAQGRGLIRAGIDADALAAMIFALTFGRSFNELAGISTDVDASAQLAVEVLGSVLADEGEAPG